MRAHLKRRLRLIIMFRKVRDYYQKINNGDQPKRTLANYVYYLFTSSRDTVLEKSLSDIRIFRRN